MTQFSSGFPKNPLSRRANGQGGFLNQTADHAARNMGSTSYSKKDVEEARDGLKLLKSRMGGATDARRSVNAGTAHSANRAHEAGMNQSNTNSDKGPVTRKNQYGGPTGSSNKPPMMPASATNLNVPPGGEGVASSSNFRNKQIQLQKEMGGYQPERRSPNAQRRQISVNSNKQGSDRGMLPTGLIANLNQQNNALNGMASAPKVYDRQNFQGSQEYNKYEVNSGDQDSFHKVQFQAHSEPLR